MSDSIEYMKRRLAALDKHIAKIPSDDATELKKERTALARSIAGAEGSVPQSRSPKPKAMKKGGPEPKSEVANAPVARTVKKAAPKNPPKAAAPRKPRVVKPKVEPVKPVEVVKSPAKKTGRVVVPKSAKQLGVTPTLRITTKNGTGNRPAGPKRPTSQKLTANETKYLAERRAALDEAAEPTPTERAAQAARERVAAKNAAAGVTPNAKGQASARAAQAARESAAAKVSAAQKAEILAKAEAKAARLAKIGAGAVRVAKVAGKVSGVATAADMAYEVATDPLGRKRAGRMMDWLKKHPNASGLDRMKAQAKNMAFRDPYLMDKYDGERPPTGNLKGSVRGRGTGGAMKKAVKAVQKPAKPAMPRSTKPAVKTPQKPAVGRLGASTHVVKHGDTLWGIARDNKTTVSAILGANPTIAERRKNGQTSIFSGTKVRIPKGK